MRKQIFAIFVIFFIVPVVSATEADFYAIKFSPTQVAPGETSTLNITLKNLGTSFASRIEARLDPEDVSPLDPIGSVKIYAGTAEGAQETEYFGVVKQFEEIEVSYDVRVKRDATEGTYTVPLVLKWGPDSGRSEQILFLGFEVVEENADLYVVDFSPKEISPGEETTLKIKIRNLGSGVAKELRITLDSERKAPLTVIGSRERYIAPVLSNLEEVEVEYPIKMDDNATVGAYDIPLKLMWKTPAEVEMNQLRNIGLKVDARPELIIGGASTNPSRTYPDSNFDLSLTIENIGKEEAESVKVLLLLPEELSGGANNFIGTIKKGSTSTITFPLKVLKSAKKGDLTVPIKIAYKENGAEKEIKKSFEIYVSERGKVDLQIAGLFTSPRKIRSGQGFELSIQIENIGKQDATAVRADISPPEEFSGKVTYFLGTLEQGDSETATFDIAISDKAEPGTYKFGMSLSYIDEKGDKFKEEKTFEVVIIEDGYKKFIMPLTVGLVLSLIFVYAWRRGRPKTSEG